MTEYEKWVVMIKPNYYKPMGTRSMESRSAVIKTDLKIENLEYKGNAALRANQ